MNEKLNEKEKLFCYYLSKLENPKEAAVKAGYNRAESSAARLMQRPEILQTYRTYSKQHEKQQLRRMLLCGIRRLAFGTAVDGTKLAVFSGEMDEQQLEQLDLFQVSELKKQRDGGFEVKFFDRYRALDMLEQLIAEEDNSDAASDLFHALDSAAHRLEPGEAADG